MASFLTFVATFATLTTCFVHASHLDSMSAAVQGTLEATVMDFSAARGEALDATVDAKAGVQSSDTLRSLLQKGRKRRLPKCGNGCKGNRKRPRCRTRLGRLVTGFCRRGGRRILCCASKKRFFFARDAADEDVAPGEDVPPPPRLTPEEFLDSFVDNPEALDLDAPDPDTLPPDADFYSPDLDNDAYFLYECVTEPYALYYAGEEEIPEEDESFVIDDIPEGNRATYGDAGVYGVPGIYGDLDGPEGPFGGYGGITGVYGSDLGGGECPVTVVLCDPERQRQNRDGLCVDLPSEPVLPPPPPPPDPVQPPTGMDPPAVCAGAYQQCGGQTFGGPTCCVEGYRCEEINDFYSQCTLLPPPPGCAEHWGQCGGLRHTGPTCCPLGFECVVRNQWYSQCSPKEVDVAE